MSEPETTTYRSCVIDFGNGPRFSLESAITAYDDWRMTPIGLFNFGKAYLHAPILVRLPKESGE